jgi:hypothetical protein
MKQPLLAIMAMLFLLFTSATSCDKPDDTPTENNNANKATHVLLRVALAC